MGLVSRIVTVILSAVSHFRCRVWARVGMLNLGKSCFAGL